MRSLSAVSQSLASKPMAAVLVSFGEPFNFGRAMREPILPRQRRVPQLALPRGPGAGQFARRLQQGQGCHIGGAAAPPTVRAEGGFGGG